MHIVHLLAMYILKYSLFSFYFVVTVGCLVLHQRYKKRYEKYMTYSRELSNPESGRYLIFQRVS